MIALDKDLKDKLQEYSKKNNVSMSKYIEKLLYKSEIFSNEIEKEIPKINEVLDNEKEKVVHVRFKESEINILKQYAKRQNIESISKYIRFVLSEKIYENNSLPNSDLLEIDKVRKELNAIGKNLNFAVKQLLIDSSETSIIKFIKEVASEINQKQNNIANKLNTFMKINKKRF